MIPDVKFIEKWITNFSANFGDFSLRKQLLLFLGISFLVTDISEYSNEVGMINNFFVKKCVWTVIVNEPDIFKKH